MGRYTHAIVARVPADPRLPNCNSNLNDNNNANTSSALSRGIDLNLARRQQESLCELLRQCGVDVIELQPEETAHVHSLWLDAQAVAAGGAALVTRPGKDHGDTARISEIEYVLRDLTWQLEHTDEFIDGQPVVLNGSDVLFTGKELFVGLRRSHTIPLPSPTDATPRVQYDPQRQSPHHRRHSAEAHNLVGTNMAGAVSLARSFPDIPVVPVAFHGDHPLKHYVGVASTKVLAVSGCKVGQEIVKRIESESSQRFETVTLRESGAAACINVNGHLIHRDDWDEVNQKLGQLSAVTAGVWPISISELLKLGGSLPQYCLLVRELRNVTKTLR